MSNLWLQKIVLLRVMEVGKIILKKKRPLLLARSVFLPCGPFYIISNDVAVWKRLRSPQHMQRNCWQIVATPSTGFKVYVVTNLSKIFFALWLFHILVLKKQSTATQCSIGILVLLEKYWRDTVGENWWICMNMQWKQQLTASATANLYPLPVVLRTTSVRELSFWP